MDIEALYHVIQIRFGLRAWLMIEELRRAPIDEIAEMIDHVERPTMLITPQPTTTDCRRPGSL